jgi:hypothetical protein
MGNFASKKKKHGEGRMVAEVTAIAGKREKKRSIDDKWLRRQALAVTPLLPENRDDALAVLAYAQELVLWWSTIKPV